MICENRLEVMMTTRRWNNHTLRLLLFGAFLSMFTSGCRSGIPDGVAPSLSAETVRLRIFSDTQLHHNTGRSILMSSPAADKIVAVSMRSPEVNLLSPLALEHALENYDPQLPVLYLGDALDVACGSEYEKFVKIMNGTTSGQWLFAPGNHDTFLAGNASSWVPDDLQIKEFVEDGRYEAIYNGPPADHDALLEAEADMMGFWTREFAIKAAYGSSLSKRGWPGICAEPKESESNLAMPLNKHMFLLEYMKHLAAHHNVKFTRYVEPEGSYIVYKGVGQSPYHDAGTLEVEVHWHRLDGPPSEVQEYIKQKEKRLNRPFFKDAWNSFVVQRVQLSDTQELLILDTSVGTNLGWLGMFAGTGGRLGERQRGWIERQLRDDALRAKTLWFAGHMPFKSIDDEKEAARLLEDSRVAGYLSSHTHEIHEKTGEPYFTSTRGVLDYSFGSTTDNNQQYTVSLSSNKKLTKTTHSAVPQHCDVTYVRAWNRIFQRNYVQSCAHRDALERLLSAHHSSEYPEKWTQTRHWRFRECDARHAARELLGHYGELEEAFRNDEQFRNYAMCLMHKGSVGVECIQRRK